MNVPSQRKVLILGLDGATFDVMRPLLQQGKLPHIASLMQGGVHGKLISTVLHHSAPAWTSFATGKNPGKHGIIGFTKIQNHSHKLTLVNGSMNKARTLWEHLGNHGRKVIVINVPMTYPPKAVNGFMVSGLDTPSTKANFTYPAHLREEILNVAPDYKINLHLGGYLHTDSRRLQGLNIISSSIKARTKVVLHLMNSYPWDFFVVRYNSPDNAQHQYWSFMDQSHPEHKATSSPVLKNAIASTYQLLDDVVGQVLQHIDRSNTTVIIMSDHGAGPRTGKSIYINEWLRHLGLLSKTGKDGQHNISRLIVDMAYVLKGRALAFLLRTLSPEVKSALMKLMPFAAGNTATYLRFSGIDWSKTKAFVGEVEGIRINLQREFPCGNVTNEDYQELRQFIIDEAMKLKDPETGRTIFRGVYKREDIFHGECVQDFPDIILKPHDEYSISPRFFGRGAKPRDSFLARDEHWRKISGSHREHGIFIINGPDCRSDIETDPVDILDIFPTVLYQMMVPMPDDLDGRIALPVFKEHFLQTYPPQFETTAKQDGGKSLATYDDEEEAKLVDHLKGLGYIE